MAANFLCNVMPKGLELGAIFVARRADVAVHHSLVLSGFYHP
jgi:hypothetical protein